MGTYTTNYNLFKPDATDLVDEALDLNANYDIVDAAIKANATSLANLSLPFLVRRTADLVLTNVDQDLFTAVPLLANKTYSFLYQAWYTVATATGVTTSSIHLTLPAGATATVYDREGTTNAPTLDTANWGIGGGTFSANGSIQTTETKGIIRVGGTAGNLNIQIKKSNADATVVTFKTNTFLELIGPGSN